MKTALIACAACVLIFAGGWYASERLGVTSLASMAQVILSVTVVNPDDLGDGGGDGGGGEDTDPTPAPSGGGGGGGGGGSGGGTIVPVTIVPQQPMGAVHVDVSGDGKIDLADFSIVAYWFQKPLTDASRAADVNGDSKINLVDFSILAYYWKRQ